MVLEGSGLFSGSQAVDIRYEEQKERPALYNNEIVLWHIPKGVLESNTTTTGSSFGLDAANDRMGQSFTVGFKGVKGDFEMTGVTFALYRVGSPGSISCNLFMADPSDGKPTGSSLASGTFDGDSLTTSTDGQEALFEFSSSYTILNGTMYACILDCASADASNRVSARISLAGSYGSQDFPTDVEEGYGLTSSDGGSNYLRPSNTDMYFKVNGNGDSMLVNIFGVTKQVPLVDVT